MSTKTKTLFVLGIIAAIALYFVIPYIIAVVTFTFKIIMVMGIIAVIAYLVGRYSKSKTL